MIRIGLAAFLTVSGWLAYLCLGAASAVALSPEDIAHALAQRFEVKILRVMPIEEDGTHLYSVVVMNPGGNFNEAFKVTNLVVDAETGELVPQFRLGSSGYTLPAASDREPPADDGGMAIRRETFRGR